jgi:2-methylcitrate dehydratase PrpD
MDAAPVTGPLADFVARTRWEDLPQAVRHEAKRSLLNYFGVALAGSRDPVVDKVMTVLQLDCAARATVIGRSERPAAYDAAFVNAISANVFDFDDTHIPTIIHPTAPVAPPLFAYAEASGLSGRDLILAFVLGVEVECRLGVAVSPYHYRRGFHITSTCGIFGAAAAMSKALGLDAEHTAWALGNASAGASGLVETLGSMSKSLGVGGSARNGWLAAMFAREGVEGPARSLEGARGFLRVMGEHAADATIVAALGDGWALTRNTYKPYPCGVVLNPVIEACKALRDEGGFDADDVESIVVTGHPLLAERADRPDVWTGREAQVSAQHAVAATLTYARAGLAEFSDERVRDPKLRALYPRVKVVQDASYVVDAARLDVRSRSGSTRTKVVECAIGSLDRPLRDADIEDKARALADHARFVGDIKPIIEAIWNLDRIEDAGSVMRLADGGGKA